MSSGVADESSAQVCCLEGTKASCPLEWTAHMYTSDPECLSLPSALPPPRIPFPPSHSPSAPPPLPLPLPPSPPPLLPCALSLATRNVLSSLSIFLSLSIPLSLSPPRSGERMQTIPSSLSSDRGERQDEAGAGEQEPMQQSLWSGLKPRD